MTRQNKLSEHIRVREREAAGRADDFVSPPENVVGGSCNEMHEGSSELGRVLWSDKVEERARRDFVFLSLERGPADLSAEFSVAVSWRRSVSGLADSGSLGYRTACRPSNVRQRVLFPHRPVWTGSFR